MQIQPFDLGFLKKKKKKENPLTWVIIQYIMC